MAPGEAVRRQYPHSRRCRKCRSQRLPAPRQWDSWQRSVERSASIHWASNHHELREGLCAGGYDPKSSAMSINCINCQHHQTICCSNRELLFSRTTCALGNKRKRNGMSRRLDVRGEIGDFQLDTWSKSKSATVRHQYSPSCPWLCKHTALLLTWSGA